MKENIFEKKGQTQCESPFSHPLTFSIYYFKIDQKNNFKKERKEEEKDDERKRETNSKFQKKLREQAKNGY